jgi:hypothetical protein
MSIAPLRGRDQRRVPLELYHDAPAAQSPGAWTGVWRAPASPPGREDARIRCFSIEKLHRRAEDRRPAVTSGRQRGSAPLASSPRSAPMKALLASLAAVAVFGATAAQAAAPVQPDVHYTYTHAGQHYKYKYHHHYYNHRSCQHHHMRTRCKYW